MHEKRSWEPPRLYSWTLLPACPGPLSLGAIGVTDDRDRAMRRAGEALSPSLPGSRALVHRVMLSFSRVGYVYEALEARGRFDPVRAVVVWEEIPAQASWGRLRALVTDSPEIIGDSIPPEAIAAGLADVENEYERRRPRSGAPRRGGR